MFFIFGLRKFGIKKVAYGKDFCNSCENEAVVDKFRWFSWIHLFFIPLIPLGYQYNYSCTICTNDPNAVIQTALWQKVIVASVFAGLNWLLYQSGIAEDLSYQVLLKVFTMLALCASIYWIYAGSKKPSKKERRKHLTPVNQETCEKCEGVIVHAKVSRCTRCKLEVF